MSAGASAISAEHVAIVGGGFTGTLLAINLLRHDGPRATLIERRGAAARGVAYSTVHPEHVLNVRAGGMSALPDDPEHFARWLARHGETTPSGFAPRRVYGDYLNALLDDAIAAAPGRLEIVAGEAVDVEPAGAQSRVRLADGRVIDADMVALAPGNLPPLPPPGLAVAALPLGCYVDDPWSSGFADGLAGDENVIVLGTGLTMVDVALLLDARGFEGRVIALSRHGLLPNPHDPATPATIRDERPPATACALVAALRDRARAVPWRSAVDELRPHTQRIWGAMPLVERRRFLRHLRAYWDVHRHRIAPEVADRLAAMRAAGRLEVAAGRISGTETTAGDVRLSWRERGTGRERSVVARRIVNGTGPQGDLTRSAEPLLRALRSRGAIRPDPLRIGLDVDQQSRAVAVDGGASDRLLVLGPMTRGAFWEIVAVPDIRRQVWSVARRLSRAEWVEGEGL